MAKEILTEAEKAADRQRKADLIASIERKDDVELNMFAKQIGLDPEKYSSRADLVTAIESLDEDNAAAGRQKIRDMETEEANSVASENDRRTAGSRIMHALNAEFCRDIPQEGRSGSFEPEDDDPRFGGDYDVPNGKYRVAGSEWLFLIAKKKIVSVERASERNKFGGKGVILID